MQRFILRSAPRVSRAARTTCDAWASSQQSAAANAVACALRHFGSGRAWSEAEPVALEAYNDGPQQIQFWRNPHGALVAQHDDIQEIEACRWAIQRTCQRVLDFSSAGNIGLPMFSRLMVLRFLLDLEDRIEHLNREGLGTCAVELFERPWIVTCDLGGAQGRHRSKKTEVLRLRPRPDGLGKRAAFAALSPVIAPIGAALTYVRMGSANTVAACKWYFRAIAELPCRIALDRIYHVENGENEKVHEEAIQLDDARRLVSVNGTIPQLGI